jgi:hypothetical protein
LLRLVATTGHALHPLLLHLVATTAHDCYTLLPPLPMIAAPCCDAAFNNATHCCHAWLQVHVYDLNQNKYQSLCSQKVVAKAKLTRLVFNPKHPILLVGDDKGCITSLKLSPNLRKTSIPESPKMKWEDMEVAKLNHVIEIAKKSKVGEKEEEEAAV